jgi:hypothetical protein
MLYNNVPLLYSIVFLLYSKALMLYSIVPLLYNNTLMLYSLASLLYSNLGKLVGSADFWPCRIESWITDLSNHRRFGERLDLVRFVDWTTPNNNETI